MKTHRIILPRDLHQQALAGVGLMVLPMKVQPQTDEVPGVVWFHVGDRTYGGKRAFAEDGCQYKQGDRLALLEPWWKYKTPDIHLVAWDNGGSRCFLDGGTYHDEISGTLWVPSDYDIWNPQPASRMPLAACRCFYLVLAVEPVQIHAICEDHARQCGFEEEKVNEFPPVRSAKSPLYESWLAAGRSGTDWAWSVRVERMGSDGK